MKRLKDFEIKVFCPYCKKRIRNEPAENIVVERELDAMELGAKIYMMSVAHVKKEHPKELRK